MKDRGEYERNNKRIKKEDEVGNMREKNLERV